MMNMASHSYIFALYSIKFSFAYSALISNYFVIKADSSLILLFTNLFPHWLLWYDSFPIGSHSGLIL